MKKIEAIIRPEKLDTVRQALVGPGYPGITLTEAEGHGTQRGTVQHWQGESYKLSFVPKIKVEMVVQDEQVEELMEALVTAAFTGGYGDGKIFVSDISEVVRIRTRERGEKALA